MTERELVREVARATGENIQTISQHGFVLLTRIVEERDREPLVVDWDEFDAQRMLRNGTIRRRGFFFG